MEDSKSQKGLKIQWIDVNEKGYIQYLHSPAVLADFPHQTRRTEVAPRILLKGGCWVVN